MVMSSLTLRKSRRKTNIDFHGLLNGHGNYLKSILMSAIHNYSAIFVTVLATDPDPKG